MAAKHLAMIALGDPRTLEVLIMRGVLARKGTFTEREIGGSASWVELPSIDWQLEWVRLRNPLGLRIDIYVDDFVGNEAIGEELWVGLLESKAVPAIPTGKEQIELPSTGGGSTTTTTGGGSTTTTTGGESIGIPSGSGGVYGGLPVPAYGGAEGELGIAAGGSSAGVVAGLVLGSLGAIGSGVALWRCRNKKKCRKRPIVVGAMVGSGLVAVGCGLFLALRK
jgi:hypothetical protein